MFWEGIPVFNHRIKNSLNFALPPQKKGILAPSNGILVRIVDFQKL